METFSAEKEAVKRFSINKEGYRKAGAVVIQPVGYDPRALKRLGLSFGTSDGGTWSEKLLLKTHRDIEKYPYDRRQRH